MCNQMQTSSTEVAILYKLKVLDGGVIYYFDIINDMSKGSYLFLSDKEETTQFLYNIMKLINLFYIVLY